LIWFMAGMLSTAAVMIALWPWLRRRLETLPVLPSSARLAAALLAPILLAGAWWLGVPARPGPSPGLAQAPMIDQSVRAAVQSAAPSTRAAGSMDSAVASLEARLARGGGTEGDWELLAKSYEFMGRAEDAARARQHQLPAASGLVPAAGGAAPGSAPTASSALPPAPVSAQALSPASLKLLEQASRARREKHLPEALKIYAKLAAADQLNADGWADYADAAATLANRKLAGPPETYIARALALDPHHPKALWLKASAAEESGRLDEAVSTWQQLGKQLDASSPDGRMVAANLERDQQLLATASGGRAPHADPALTSSRTVSGEVSLAGRLRDRVAPGTTLFIVAKSVDSPGPPLAVFRQSVGDWPIKFTLDDSQAMLPGRNLSGAGRITVEARVSKSGQAMPTPGDLRGTSGIIEPSDRRTLKIVIDDIVS
jgi:cytochrome c-type biogenesis protein CcmH/NrfG